MDPALQNMSGAARGTKSSRGFFAIATPPSQEEWPNSRPIEASIDRFHIHMQWDATDDDDIFNTHEVTRTREQKNKSKNKGSAEMSGNENVTMLRLIEKERNPTAQISP